ncbi:glucosyltransferase domain-containing protein [Pseudocitrobacter faecalis]|uniref:glucosyltransferase domain-containing protein n=1 Tax=Pseudocitrobacter faecalis TaxID=1398493 RepID=UPI003BA28B61
MEKRYTSFIWLFIIPVVFYLPVTTSDVLYRDDIIRSINNFTGWWWMGRPASDYLWRVISIGDIAPIMQPLPGLMSISALAMSVYVLYISYEKFAGSCSYIYFTPLLISPYLLQNMSYQYDNITMFLPLSLSYLSAAFLFREKWYSWFALSAFIFVSLSLYQMVVNVFVVISLFYITTYIIKNNSLPIKNTIFIAISFLVALILYKLLVIDVFVTSTKTQMVGSFGEVFENISKSITKIKMAFSKTEGIMLAALAIFSFTSVLSMRISHVNKIVLTLLLIIATQFIYGPFILLTIGVVDARQFMSFGAIVFVFIITASNNKFLNKPVKLIVVLLSLCFVVTSYKYTSALKNQYSYEKMMSFNIAQKLSETFSLNDEIFIQGHFRFTPQANHVTWNNPLIKDMMQRNSWYPRMLISSFYKGKVRLDWDNGYLPEATISKGEIIYSNQDFMISKIEGKNIVLIK